MAEYEITTEDGSVYQITTDDEVATQPSQEPQWVVRDPTWGEAAQQVGKDLGRGAFKAAPALLGLVNDAGNYLADKMNPLGSVQKDPFQTTKRFSSDASRLFDALAGNPADTVTGKAADYTRAALESAAAPGGPIVNAASGLMAQAAANALPNSRIAPLVAALLPVVAAKAVPGIAGKAEDIANAFERKSVGASSKDYQRSMKQSGLMEDAETGDFETRLGKAINEIGKDDGWGALRSPQSIKGKVAKGLEESGKPIREMLKKTDAGGDVVVPMFEGKNSAVTQALGAERANRKAMQKALDEFLAEFEDPKTGWNGTATDLNKWKTQIAKKGFAGEATGELPSEVKRRITRAIFKDLQEAERASIVKAKVATPEKVDEAMRRYSNYKEVEPVANYEVGRDAAGTVDMTARALLRTTGGTLTTPTLIGGLVAGGMGGAPIGLATGALLSLLGTPTGRGIMASAMLRPGANLARTLTTGGAGNGSLASALLASAKLQDRQ